MSYREALLVARIRQELRRRLMSENVQGVWDLLARFDRLADLYPELASEAERWRIRFHLLGLGLAVDTVRDFPAA
jgi:hypothetical protein